MRDFPGFRTIRDFLAFRTMVTPLLVQIVFWVVSIAAIVTGIQQWVFRHDPVGGLLWIVLGPLLTRAFLELTMVYFSIHSAVEDIRKAFRGQLPEVVLASPGPTPPPAPQPPAPALAARLFSAPAWTARTGQTLPVGQDVRLLGEEGAFTRVQLPDGAVAWVVTEELRPRPTAAH